MIRRFGLGVTAVGMLATVGCSSMCSDQVQYADAKERTAGNPTSGAQNSGGAASTAIAEADIIQLDGPTLYAISKSGTLNAIDVGTPSKLALLGKAQMSGTPFEMIKRGNVIFALSTRAVDRSGAIIAPPTNGAGPATTPGADAVDPNTLGSLLTAFDVTDPAKIRTIATFPIIGEIADSRLVGGILYVATYENASCYKCGTNSQTVLTSFDVSSPEQVHEVTHDSFESSGVSAETTWGAPWKRSLHVTDSHIYVGGLTTSDRRDGEGVIDVIDITNPTGHFSRGPRLKVAGPIMNRWQMDESDGVLRVVSQAGSAITAQGSGAPMIETFTVAGAKPYALTGRAAMKLPRQEGLRTVRFDGPRGYAITFNQTDPLFVLDLSNPAAPAQKGELEMPGWIFHIEPHGDRLVGLGVDSRSAEGALNVSLFDVADASKPKLIDRASFGAGWMPERAVTQAMIPEDQDRIHKAFRVFDDGLIVVPVSGGDASMCQPTTTSTGANGSSAANGSSPSSGAMPPRGTGGVQIIDWRQDSLTKRGYLQVSGNARRAFPLGKELITVSDTNVTTFDLALVRGAKDGQAISRNTADLAIGLCTPGTNMYGDGYVNDGMYEGDSGNGGAGCFPLFDR